MFDAGKVITGLIIFLVLVTFPLWYGAFTGMADEVPDPELAPHLTDSEGNVLPGMHCLRDAEYMRASHMDLLNEWRDRVVRDGERLDEAADGRHFVMSLQNTCMSCHSNKANFCDSCHGYMGVSPYCWECHVEPTPAGAVEGGRL
jgi:hypothetical protein